VISRNWLEYTVVVLILCIENTWNCGFAAGVCTPGRRTITHHYIIHQQVSFSKVFEFDHAISVVISIAITFKVSI